jgi:hypothetical protein
MQTVAPRPTISVQTSVRTMFILLRLPFGRAEGTVPLEVDFKSSGRQ